MSYIEERLDDAISKIRKHVKEQPMRQGDVVDKKTAIIVSRGAGGAGAQALRRLFENAKELNEITSLRGLLYPRLLDEINHGRDCTVAAIYDVYPSLSEDVGTFKGAFDGIIDEIENSEGSFDDYTKTMENSVATMDPKDVEICAMCCSTPTMLPHLKKIPTKSGWHGLFATRPHLHELKRQADKFSKDHGDNQPTVDRGGDFGPSSAGDAMHKL